MTDRIDREIERFFGEQVLPLRGKLKAGDAGLLVMHLEKAAPSYFVRRAKAGMGKADFEAGGCASPETVEADLVRAWGAGSLAALAPGIARLARSLRQTERESSEVSEFVYAMY